MYRNQSFFVVIILVILHNINASISSSHYIDSRYKNCVSNSSSSCGGTLIKISYPFWGNGHPQYCGHPGFDLSCDGTNNLTVNIMSDTYKVKGIDYNTSTLKLAREEFSQGICPGPKELQNTTLDLTLFNYTSNVKNATLFYDCPETINNGAPFSFFCPGKYPNPLSFFVITQEWENKLDKICGVKVYVPVFVEATRVLLSNSMGVREVLRKGFEVKWVIDQGYCQKCYNSGGCCGYNITLGHSTCFCEDGAYSITCPATAPASAPTPSSQKASNTSKSLNTDVKIGIGIAAAAGGLIILSIFFVILRSSKEYQSSTLASEKITDVHPSIENREEKSTYFGAHLFSYKELEQATNNFDTELGKGGFGTVYYGKLQDGRDVAIKKLYEKHNKQISQFMNELEILTRLDHKNLVKLYGCTPRKSRELMLVYEHVPNGTVSEHLHGKRAKPGFLPWPIRLRIAIETASALVYLHASDIIHRDVKTKNILLDVNYCVKVADFGLSRLFPLDATHVSTTPQGSPGYVDPEYYECYQLTNKSDVYSFGVVLAELLSAKPAVDRSRNRQEINLSSFTIKKIQNNSMSEFVDPLLGFESSSRVREEVTAVAELTFQCLQATRETRPSMEEVLHSLTALQCEDSKVEEMLVVTKDSGFASSCAEDRSQMYTSGGAHSQVSVVVNVSSETL